MAKRLILIPPSEGKDVGGDDRRALAGFDPTGSRRVGALGELDETLVRRIISARSDVAAELMTAMASLDRSSLQKLLGATGETLEAAVAANANLSDSPVMPAIERYTGVLYQHLDAASLDGWSLRRLNSQVLIASGLWGLVAPEEGVAEYRLKMSASLPGLGRLSTWWRPLLTEALGDLSRGRDVWNLLPDEHRAAVPLPDEPGAPVEHTRRPVNTVTFLEPSKSGEMRPVNHWNKAHKGELVRFLVTNGDARPADLLDWEHPAGFRLDPESLDPVDGVRRLRFVLRKRRQPGSG